MGAAYCRLFHMKFTVDFCALCITQTEIECSVSSALLTPVVTTSH